MKDNCKLTVEQYDNTDYNSLQIENLESSIDSGIQDI